jgi:hypothetical protein
MMSSHGAGTEGLPTTKHGIIDQVIPNRNGTGSPSLTSQLEHINPKEPDVAGKKRPKSLAQTGSKAPAKYKRPKKTSRGK